MKLGDAVRIAVALPLLEAAPIYLALWTTAKTAGDFAAPLRLSNARLIRGSGNPSIRPFRIHKDRMAEVLSLLNAIGLIVVQRVGGPQAAKIRVSQLSEETVSELLRALNRVLRVGLERELFRALLDGRASSSWKEIEDVFTGQSMTAIDLTPGLTPPRHAVDAPGATVAAPVPAVEPGSGNGTAGAAAGDPALLVMNCVSGIGAGRPAAAPPVAVDTLPLHSAADHDRMALPLERNGPLDGPEPPRTTTSPRSSGDSKKFRPIKINTWSPWEQVWPILQTLFGPDSLRIKDSDILPSPDDLTPYRTVRLLREGIVRKDWQWSPREAEPLRYLRTYWSWLIVEGMRADGSIIKNLTFLAGRTRKDSHDSVDPALMDVTIAGHAYRVVLAQYIEKPFLAPARGAWPKLWESSAIADNQAYYLRGVKEGHVPTDPVQFLTRLTKCWGTGTLRSKSPAEVAHLLDRRSVGDKAMETYAEDLKAQARFAP